jgi:hypothetical protein
MEYVGGSFRNPGTAAIELLGIYQRRLAHCLERGVRAAGIDVLLAALRTVPSATAIAVDPFLSPGRSLTAFYHPGDVLIACVTVERSPGDAGAKNLAFAMEE